MNDAAMLLKACRMNPAEDTPRLALADAIQDQGYEGAASHIRESIHFARNGKNGKRWRASTGRDYGKWLGNLLGVNLRSRFQPLPLSEFAKAHDDLRDDPDTEEYICAGESWDQFIWVGGDYHRCTFTIRRGLPEAISVTAPQLLRDVLKLFQFPLTACEVCDRKPLRDAFGGETLWLWSSVHWPQKFSTWLDEPHALPPMLYSRLGNTGRRWRSHYVRRADAILNLNAAAMEYGEVMFRASELRPDYSCQDIAKS